MADGIKPVLVGGGYWTGSSAVVDLLREHERCAVVPGEFWLFSQGEFFKDLHAMHASGRVFDDVVDRWVRYMRRCNADPHPIKHRFPELHKWTYVACEYYYVYPRFLYPKRRQSSRRFGDGYSDACEDLVALLLEAKRSGDPPGVEEAREIVEDVLRAAAPSGDDDDRKENVYVFDQLSQVFYTEYADEYISDALFVNVDRNWKDQYVELREESDAMNIIFNRKKSLGFNPMGGELEGMNSDRPISFAKLRDKIKAKREIQRSMENVLWTDFEDLVHDKERVAKQIVDFIGVPESKWSESGRHFREGESRKNIGKWRRYDMDGHFQAVRSMIDREGSHP